jgi:hypothetical protein
MTFVRRLTRLKPGRLPIWGILGLVDASSAKDKHAL